MDEQNKDSFKNLNLKERIGTVIGIALLMVLVIGFVFGIFLFGFAGIFELLGVHYQSIGSLVIFVVSFFVLGLLVDLFVDAMANFTIEQVSGNVSAYVIIDVWICIELVCSFYSRRVDEEHNTFFSNEMYYCIPTRRIGTDVRQQKRRKRIIIIVFF